MDNKKQYNSLDDIGFVGVQVKQTAVTKRYHEKKTGEIIRAHRLGLTNARKSSSKKKVTQ